MVKDEVVVVDVAILMNKLINLLQVLYLIKYQRKNLLLHLLQEELGQ